MRKQLHITSVSEAYRFVDQLREASDDEFILTNEDGSRDADPRDYLGIFYAMSEFDKVYMINKTNDGVFPEFIREDKINDHSQNVD